MQKGLQSMKGKRSVKNSQEQQWESAANFYESSNSFVVLASGKPVGVVLRRKSHSPGRIKRPKKNAKAP